MLALNLEPELERQMSELAKRTGQSVDALIQEALERMIEDADDVALLETALRDPDAGKTISHDQLKRELGLES